MSESRAPEARSGSPRQVAGGLAALALALLAAACGGKSDVVAPAQTVVPLPAFTMVAAGASHSCALTGTGDVYCWGRGASGALGVDSLVSLTHPTPVAKAAFGAAWLSAGFEYSCAVTTAGEAYCWGQGESGQLGTGLHGASRTPAPVAGQVRFTSVSTGMQHTCGLTRAGVIYCWGRNQDAELGNLAAGADSAAPGQPVYDPTDTFTAVTAGRHHSCGLTTTHLVRCWGWNVYGQLGVGSNTGLGAPITVKGGLLFSQVSAGDEFTCALTTAGAAYCWGRNEFGQLGDGSTADANVPLPVSGGLAFVALGAGGTHVCGLTADGTAYCWGSNSDGQLGTGGGPGLQTAPTAVAGSVRFRQISAGGLHTCAVTSAGAVWCWGFGGYGQLGTGMAHSSTRPVAAVP